MKPCAHCGADIGSTRWEEEACPACLLRIGLEPAAPAADLVIESEAYRVLGPIGRGPNGTVYLGCRVRQPQRFVTVKVIEQPVDVEIFLPLMHDLLDRLPVSARMRGAGRLIETIVTNEGRACVCAEYAAGVAADQYFAASGPSRERLEVLVDICERVAELHRCRLAHGSIKAHNVIIVASSNGCMPALLDMGMRPTIEASWISRRAGRRDSDRPGEVFGEHNRRADVDDLRDLISSLLKCRTDIASVCDNIWPDARGANWQTAEDVATDLKSALGHMQGVRN